MVKLRLFTGDEIKALTKNFAKKREIGQPGAYGQVYKASIRRNMIPDFPDCPRKLAIKVCKLNNKDRETMWEVMFVFSNPKKLEMGC